METNPTFNELMAESPYAGPSRTPILDHTAVINGVIEWFQNKAQWRAVETEMKLPQTEPERRVDLISWNRSGREFYIIEAKAQWNDFVRDRKFFDYQKWCNWFAFAVPEELAACARRRMEDIPGWYEGVGLLVIPNDFSPRRMVRRPAKNEMTGQTYEMMVEQWAWLCHGRMFDARRKIAELEWRLSDALFEESPT